MNKCYELLEKYTRLYNSLEDNIKPRKKLKIIKVINIIKNFQKKL